MSAINEARKRAPFIRNALLSWARVALRDFPWRKKRTPYSVLMAEFMLKRTTSTAVNRIYEKFLALYPSIEALLKADVKEIEGLLKAIGYHRLRAQEIKEAATYIANEFRSDIPLDMDKLLSIPYVGPYTAAAILSLGYDIRAPMVDSNVERIIHRLFRNSMPTRSLSRTTREVANVLLPDERHDTFNLAFIDLGAIICTYRQPYCEKCPLGCQCDTTHSRRLKF
jgi:A/G-specific adenine glycosylase